MPMTATAILIGAVGQQPPAPIRVRTDKRTNIAWFASDPSAHSSIVKLIRKRAVIRMLDFAFYPLEHKLGNAARTIQCSRTLTSICHAEKDPGRMARKNRGTSELKSWRMRELRSITLAASVLGKWNISWDPTKTDSPGITQLRSLCHPWDRTQESSSCKKPCPRAPQSHSQARRP